MWTPYQNDAVWPMTIGGKFCKQEGILVPETFALPINKFPSSNPKNPKLGTQTSTLNHTCFVTAIRPSSHSSFLLHLW